MRSLSHFVSVLLLALYTSVVAAQVTTPVHEVELVPGAGLGITVKFKKGGEEIPVFLYIHNVMSMSTLPEEVLKSLGGIKTEGEVTWPLTNGTLATAPIYRVGPIFIGTCRIETTYFVGNTYNQAWIGQNLLELFDYHGFLLSQNKMMFFCPQEIPKEI